MRSSSCRERGLNLYFDGGADDGEFFALETKKQFDFGQLEFGEETEVVEEEKGDCTFHWVYFTIIE